ncbi:hypothetical protein MBCUT_19300 [Methanobrevibacter cuticularis]|uniref:Uncharacterized protein n=1 Tax=Methanobrevibacter cuticularis TaxID=47311 RepID=A0A166CS13_9EURY|nr:hypothetical protein [Methanobrevibacter cuticularis]KZX14802.1 hypothetical protein MBCUT_19300 [Methanobrevibacter cuticularis]
MKKRNYTIIALLLILLGAATFAASFFVFQGDEKGVCEQCKMLNCHEHATGDNYCCEMCEMGEGSKCDCDMPTSNNETDNMDMS